MKKVFKKINVLGLALIMISGVILITQSAFRSKRIAPNYGYNQLTGSWEPAGTVKTTPGDLEEGEYRCNESEFEVCSAFFLNGPSEINNPSDPTAQDVVPGTYEPYEAP